MSPLRLALHEELGRGGQGVVRRGVLDHPSGARREVAIKMLMPAEDVRFAADAIARLRDEANALAALNHPAIPDFVDLFVVDGQLAMASRYVEGHDLGALLEQGIHLSPRATAEVMATLAGALDAAWNAPGPDGRPLRLLHRDLKPSNVRLDASGRPWLLDFGLARSQALPRHAQTGSIGIVGTAAYLAPERLLGQPATLDSDVFSLGLLGLDLLGAPIPSPDAGPIDPSLLDPTSWSARLDARLAEVPDLPAAMADALRHLMAWDPAARPGPAEARTLLLAHAADTPGPTLAAWVAAHPPPPTPRGDPADVVHPEPLAPAAPPATEEVSAPFPWIPAGIAVGLLLALVGLLAGPGDGTRAVARTAPPASLADGPAASAPVPEREADEASVPAPPPAATAPAAQGTATPRRPSDPAPPEASISATLVDLAMGDQAPVGGGAAGPGATGTWRPESPGARVRLRRDDAVRGPGTVPAGLWTVEADFGDGHVQAGEITVDPGDDVVVRCMPWLKLCEVTP